MLASYAHLLEDDEKYAERARAFSARVRDVGQQLEAIGFRNGAAIGPERTTYDASCHLLHGQHGAAASLQMLWAIPKLNLALLKDSDVCCGGAGVYNLIEPELSEQVLAEKLKNIQGAAPRSWRRATPVVTCRLQPARVWQECLCEFVIRSNCLTNPINAPDYMQKAGHIINEAHH